MRLAPNAVHLVFSLGSKNRNDQNVSTISLNALSSVILPPPNSRPRDTKAPWGPQIARHCFTVCFVSEVRQLRKGSKYPPPPPVVEPPQGGGVSSQGLAGGGRDREGPLAGRPQRRGSWPRWRRGRPASGQDAVPLQHGCAWGRGNLTGTNV